MILLIDNYDSFTYILYQYISEFIQVQVIKNDDPLPPLETVSAVVLSPGPGLPKSSGLLMQHIQALLGKRPLLGVCLGHQAIAEAFGAHLEQSKEIFHGRVSKIRHSGNEIFNGIPNPMQVNRYHSWIVSKNNFPKELKITAETEDGFIMGFSSMNLENVYGIQFHPESILTEYGKEMIGNFCELVSK